MKISSVSTIITLFFLLAAGTAGFAKKEGEKKKKNRIVASPIVFYTPETSMTFGAAGSYIFRMDEDKTRTRPSSVSPLIMYTLKKQFTLQLGTDLYFKKNDYRVQALVRVEKYPLKYYGIGIDTVDENEEVYTPRAYRFFLSVLKNIGKGFNIGLQYQIVNWELLELEEDGLLAKGKTLGIKGGVISGVSFVLNRDTRDHIYAPRHGDLFEFNFRTHLEFLGSEYEYTDLKIDLRKYFPLFKRHTLAIRGLLQSQDGDVPFFQLAGVGGPYLMRGYYIGRFRDKNMMAMEAELRIRLSGRFGAVVFGGVANVAPKFSDLDFNKLKPAYGIGLRYLFLKKEKIWLRMDIAFGENSTGFYVSVFEAF